MFMRQLHTQLVNPFLEKRLSIATLSKRLRDNIQDLLPTNIGEGTSQQADELDAKKRKGCSLCSYKKNRMTKVRCLKCEKNICGEHKIEICVNCAKLI
ncbi:hypothetical protein K1T71_012614 [Dendrolimus kikuchii]|uniref:Uncharacterized protein n=1 Tax=Dendrolimus kikuchii TaxID=765133 RepID=A0ACC1CJS7_9NEOP|nr:hypothetical protein K1T71_012614 [Dendrolimus kikuchii]